MEIVEVEEIPGCPYCKKQLTTIWQITRGLFIDTVVFMCPLCRAFLGAGRSQM